MGSLGTRALLGGLRPAGGLRQQNGVGGHRGLALWPSFQEGAPKNPENNIDYLEFITGENSGF